MLAVRCLSHGPPENLSLGDIDKPAARDNEALVEVYAASLNFPDGLQIRGKYQFQPDMPFIPGSEAAGIVRETGSGLDGFAPGDRVMATPGLGAFAELVAVPAQGLRRIPDNMDFPTAAAFPMVYTTSYYALKQRARLAAGETLLVLGAGGGVGMAAVELGKIMGARVIAAAGSQEKLAFAQKLGADELVDYSDGELKEKVKNLTGGAGADVIYDPVGGDLFDQCCRCINWNGRLLVIGFTSGRIPSYKANLALLKGSSMVGVFLGRFRKEEPAAYEQNFGELLEMYEQGKIKPLITQKYPLRDYVSAFNVFTERRALGKVILEMKSE